MRRMLLAAFAFVVFCGSAVSQAKPPDPEEFFTRLNALDDWFITMDGKEDNKAVVDRFMELFSPDAYVQVGPSKNQLGGVTYHGVEGIRKWADQFSKSNLDLNYRINFKTREEKTAKPVYTFQMPSGEQGAAVEFTAVYTNRTDRNRFWIPGAAFFTFDKDGKIIDLRLYMLRDEAEQTKTYVAM